MSALSFEALVEELGLSPWWAALLVEEVRAGSAVFPSRVAPEGRALAELSGEEVRALPFSAEFVAEARRRFAAWV